MYALEDVPRWIFYRSLVLIFLALCVCSDSYPVSNAATVAGADSGAIIVTIDGKFSLPCGQLSNAVPNHFGAASYHVLLMFLLFLF